MAKTEFPELPMADWVAELGDLAYVDQAQPEEGAWKPTVNFLVRYFDVWMTIIL